MPRCRLPGERLFASGILLKLSRFYGLFSSVPAGFANPDRGPRSHIFGAAAASVFPYPHPVEMDVLISQPKSSQNGKVDATGYRNIISNYDPATFCNL
jgi:hypothetical protein